MKLRVGDKTANGYAKRMFADPWSRYLPRKSGTPSIAMGIHRTFSGWNPTQPVPPWEQQFYPTGRRRVLVFCSQWEETKPTGTDEGKVS